MNTNLAADLERSPSAARARRRARWMDALTGLLAASPYWLDPRWMCDETGTWVPSWDLITEHPGV